MRKIKFRAWDNEKEQLEYPIDKIIATENGIEFNMVCYRFMNGGMPVITSFGDCLRYPSRYILMQFTGLLDKKDRGFWTLVDGASSGDKVFNVDNALFLGAPGETIKTAAGATGVIDSINYATNEITTVENITVLDDEGIGLSYLGASLDAGAYEYDAEYDYSIGRITVGTNQITVGTNQIEIVE